jgi:hypothetical protein
MYGKGDPIDDLQNANKHIVGDVLRQFSYSIRKACMITINQQLQHQQCLFAFCKSSNMERLKKRP